MVRVPAAFLGVLALALVALAQAESGAVTTAAGALAQLNAERRANGIPGTIKEVPFWSTACAAHNNYMTVNNHFDHPETKGKPAYSALGNWAGTNAVLAERVPWLPHANPFETAPIHLIQMLAPPLVKAGVSIGPTFTCMTTWPGYDESTVPGRRVYTFPGDGARDVPASETARELPAIPQQFVGIPVGQATGPHLFAYGTGLGRAGYDARITKATLLDPFGKPVAVRTVDRSTRSIGSALPPGSGMIIPVSPLLEGAPYQASVTISSSAGTLTYTWTFETAGSWAGPGKPVIAMHPPHSAKVELANTATTLAAGIAPLPVQASPLSNQTPAKPSVSIPSSVSSKTAFTFGVTVPDRSAPFDLVLFEGSKQVGVLGGLVVGRSPNSIPVHTLFPRLAARTVAYQYGVNWTSSPIDSSASVTFTVSATGGVLEPGTYRLLAKQAGKSGSTTFAVRP